MEDSIFFRRQSKRSFLDKEIEPEKLDHIYEKIRWSPSCSNNQPWRFIFVKDQQQREKLFPALARGNAWMQKAPLLVVLCAREADDYNREDDPVKYYQFDCGLATMSLLLAATEEGLMTHATAGWSAPPVRKALDIPDEYHVMCIVAMGYAGSAELLDDHTRTHDEAPRERKRLEAIIVENRFHFTAD